MSALAHGRYRRLVSGMERAWVVAADVFGPFCNQLVLEGEGSLDPEAWRVAADVAGAANPGSRVVLRGVLGGCAWVDTGVAPRVRSVDGSSWDGTSPTGAPFLTVPLDVRRGPTTEVLLVSGTPPRVVIRTSHATMDGGGTVAFAQDLIAARSGARPSGHRDPGRDRDLAEGLGGADHPAPQHDAVAPTGQPRATAPGMTWRRADLGVPGRGLLGRVCQALVDTSRAHGVGVVRLEFPADLRRHRSEVRSTANLTGIVPVDVSPAMSGADVVGRLRERVQAHAHADAVRSAEVLRHVPLWLARWVARRGARTHARTGRYGSSAIVSNLGRLDVATLSGDDWRTEDLMFIPPGTPVTPAFVGLWGTAAGSRVCVSMPQALASDGRLNALVESIVVAAG